MSNQGKGQYHLVPEEGRPSMESVADDQPLLESNVNARHPHETPVQRSTTIAFKPSWHITLFFRLLALIFHLTAIILFHNAPSHNIVPSLVFLYFALVRNSYIIFCHFLSKCIRIDISLHGDGVRKPKLPAWLTRTAVPLLIDGVIFLCLMIVLPLGLKSTRRAWGYYSTPFDAFYVAFVGMPFFLLGAIDCGRPENLAIGASLELSFVGRKSETAPSSPEMASRDVEAQLPEEYTPADQDAQEVSSNLL